MDPRLRVAAPRQPYARLQPTRSRRRGPRPGPDQRQPAGGVVARDHWAFSEVEQVISLDQGLTGRLLQVANSAASATLMPIGTVKDAIIRVGVGPVLSFSMACCIGPQFKRALPEYGLSEGDLWRHSVATSLAAEIIMAMAPNPVPAEAVTAALIHDVGKLVLARFLDARPAAGARGRPGARATRTSMQAEVDVLGVHHGQLGGLIARQLEPARPAGRGRHPPPHARIARRTSCAMRSTSPTSRRSWCWTSASQPSRGRRHARPNPPCSGSASTGAFLDRLCNHVSRRLEEVMARYAVATQAARPREVTRSPGIGAPDDTSARQAGGAPGPRAPVRRGACPSRALPVYGAS